MRIKTTAENSQIYIKEALKLAKFTAFFDSTERLFQYFAPLNEKHL